MVVILMNLEQCHEELNRKKLRNKRKEIKYSEWEETISRFYSSVCRYPVVWEFEQYINSCSHTSEIIFFERER
jgi:hypothetical protein